MGAGWVTTSSRWRITRAPRTWTGGVALMLTWRAPPSMLTLCMTSSTRCARCQRARPAHQCACQSPVFTKSRVLVMCWRDVSSKVFTVEMHHQRAEQAQPGDNVGLNIKGLDKQNMPRGGDVMVYKKDTTLGQTAEFDAQ